MKCDELKYERLDDAFETYPDSTLVIRKQYVDAAIAELKAEKEKLDDLAHAHNLELLQKENAISDLKRARWLARAERAVAEQTIDEWSRYKEKHPCGSWRADPFDYWVMAWIYVEKLCRKKSKEFK